MYSITYLKADLRASEYLSRKTNGKTALRTVMLCIYVLTTFKPLFQGTFTTYYIGKPTGFGVKTQYPNLSFLLPGYTGSLFQVAQRMAIF